MESDKMQEQVELIRQYIIQRSHDWRDELQERNAGAEGISAVD